jgi:HD-like signal output (HDOD) protein
MTLQNPSDGPATTLVPAEVCLVERDAGFGKALALAFGEIGAKVTVFDRGGPALEHVKRGATDVVIASDNLTDPSCAALLRRVQNERPEVMRMVLSGEDGVELFRRVPYAHQFLRRSATSGVLQSGLSRALEARAMLNREKLRSLVLSSNALPAAPKLYSELIDLLADPRCSLVKVVDVIERDLAMSTRLMQLISSAFFGLGSQVSSLGGCVAYLGLNTVRSLVLSAEITRMYPIQIQGFSIEKVHARALATSRLARRLAAQNTADEWQAFVAGLLHGTGTLVLASRAPKRFAEATALTNQGLPAWQAQEQVFGATDAQVAAFLLAIWGQPLEVVLAIANQDVPERSDSRAPGLATIIYLSKRLSQNPDLPLGQGDLPESELNEPFLAKIGVLDSLPQYRDVARRLAS